MDLEDYFNFEPLNDKGKPLDYPKGDEIGCFIQGGFLVSILLIRLSVLHYLYAVIGLLLLLCALIVGFKFKTYGYMIIFLVITFIVFIWAYNNKTLYISKYDAYMHIYKDCSILNNHYDKRKVSRIEAAVSGYFSDCDTCLKREEDEQKAEREIEKQKNREWVERAREQRRQERIEEQEEELEAFWYVADPEDFEEESRNIEDGTYSADVDYYNPNTGYSENYILDVEVQDGYVVEIYFPNGGYLDSSHIDPTELDEDGDCTVYDDEGREYEIHIDY